jgi:ABC-type multidrug transport system ATPase subunit
VPLIDVDSLTREFTITERDSGLGGALRSVVRRHTKSITAVRDVSFTLEGGTVLGLLGPNGSGKTTTLKCVAGCSRPRVVRSLFGDVDLRWVLAAVALTAAVLWVTSRLWNRELRNYAGAMG